MADDESTTEEGTTTEQEAPATDAPDEDLNLGDKGKQALDRMKAERDEAKREAKANAAAAARLKEIEDASKSEAQRATERLAAMEKELAAARVDGLRLRVAAKHGISEEDADLFLTGSDEESLTRQAERLQARDADRRTAEDERAKNGLRVSREGHGVSTHDDKDSSALSVLGFG